MSFGFQSNQNQYGQTGNPGQQSAFGQQPQSNAIALPDASNANAFKSNPTPTFGSIGNQGQSGQGLFGQKQSQPGGGLFGGTQQTTGFGQQQQSPGFGQQQAPGFGQQQQAPGFGQPQASGFGQQQKFGGLGTQQNQPMGTMGSTQGGLFGQQKPMSFGGTQQNAPSQNIFGGSGTTQPFGANTTQAPGFGASTTPGGFGFGQQQQGTGQTTGMGMFGQTKPTGFGGTGATGTGGGAFQPSQQGFGQQTQSFGLGQPMGTGTSTQGTTSKQYEVRKNAKNNNVHNIRFIPNYSNVPLNILRMQDYNLHKNNQMQNPQLSSSFNNYLQTSSGSQGQSFQGAGPTPLGMGSTNTQQQGTGLFGQTTQPSQPSTFGTQQKTGPFGTPNLLTSNVISSQPSQPFGGTQPTGQFGSQQTGPSTTPFGQQQQQPQQTGGLFGTSQTGTAQGGLFGGQQQGTNQGGLGGQQQQTTTPGGLFGGQQTSGAQGGLFGQQQQQKPSQGGLFGTQQTGTSQGGLFGTQQTGTTQGGLFGGQQTGAQPSSLFGTSTPSISKPQESNQISLFGGQQPSTFGGTGTSDMNKTSQPLLSGTQGGGLFGGTTQQNTGLFGATQPSTGPSLFTPPSQPGAQQQTMMQPQQQGMMGGGNTIQLPSFEGLKNPYCIYIVPGQPSGQFDLSDFKKPSYSDLMDDFSNFKMRKDYDEDERYKRAESAFYEPPTLNFKKNVVRSDRYKKTGRKLFSRHAGDAKNFGTIKFLDNAQRRDDDRFEPIHVQSFIRKDEEEEGMIRLEVILFKDDKRIELAEYFKLDGLVAEIIQFLAKKKGLLLREDIKRFKVYKDEHELDNLFSLDEYELQHGDRVVVALDTSKFRKQKEPANPEILPKKSNNYTTKPSFSQLEKMTEDELKAVPNFTVISEHAILEFEDPVDLRNVDIDKAIKMSHKMVDVYPESEFGDEKPQIGEKLNKPAFITFKNFNLNKQSTTGKFITKLKEMAASMNATVIDVDKKNDTVKIYVEHF